MTIILIDNLIKLCTGFKGIEENSTEVWGSGSYQQLLFVPASLWTRFGCGCKDNISNKLHITFCGKDLPN